MVSWNVFVRFDYEVTLTMRKDLKLPGLRVEARRAGVPEGTWSC